MHPFSAPTPLRHAFWLLSLLCLLALFAALLTPAYAQSGKRVALLIGNASYTVGRLTNPPNDVREMQTALEAVGFNVQIVLNANQNQMKRAVRDFGAQAQGVDVAFLYYCGHATQARGENYLIPVQATIDKEADYEVEAVAANTIMAQIVGARPKAAIVVLDACRDNPLAATTRSTSKGLGRMDAPTGTMIAFATAPNTTASDNGLYAQTLARHIRTPGLELLDVFRRTSAEVRRASNNVQDPRISEVSINDNLYLAGQGAAAPTRPVQIASVVPEPVRTAPVAQPAPQLAQPVQAPAPQPAPPTAQVLRPGSVIKDCADCPELVVIPAGRFMMGSNDGKADEKPTHFVQIEQFAIGKTEVTQAQWQAVMGSNPSRFTNCGPTCPVEQVSWNDVQQFIQKLNAKTSQSYRLPSEAEWEYAVRAGSQSKYSFGDSEGQLGQHAWYFSNTGNSTKPVAGKQANAFGLHDMHGNVWEWVEDCWHDNYNGAPTDGSAWTTNCTNNRRVRRGGSWSSGPAVLRSANRSWFAPELRDVDAGFRLARTLVTP